MAHDAPVLLRVVDADVGQSNWVSLAFSHHGFIDIFSGDEALVEAVRSGVGHGDPAAK